MAIKLNTWSATNGFQRIYVNGISSQGKVWLQSQRGRTVVQFEKSVADVNPADVLHQVAIVTLCDPADFRKLWEAVDGLPAPKRGAKPGTKASSRRGQGIPDQPRPSSGGWTAEHTAILDPNRMTDPLTEKVTIIVDDREPAEIVDILRTVVNLEVKVATLETGDYLIEDRLVVERKTAKDLVDSVQQESQRIFTQTDRMASSGMRSVLLVEGEPYSQTNMQLPHMSGLLSYLGVIQGVALIPTLSLQHTAYMLVKMARHAVLGLGYEIALRGTASADASVAAAFVIEGIPGVSAKTARVLHQAFGSVAALAQASIEELRAIPGIGPKRALTIYEVLRANPKAE